MVTFGYDVIHFLHGYVGLRKIFSFGNVREVDGKVKKGGGEFMKWAEWEGKKGINEKGRKGKRGEGKGKRGRKAKRGEEKGRDGKEREERGRKRKEREGKGRIGKRGRKGRKGKETGKRGNERLVGKKTLNQTKARAKAKESS